MANSYAFFGFASCLALSIASITGRGGILFTSAATLVDNVCYKTHDSHLCASIISSDPRSAKATIAIVLAADIVDLASYAATNTKFKIHSLLESEKDPVRASLLSLCDTLYAQSIGFLRDAGRELKSGDHIGFELHGYQVSQSASNCEVGFSKPSVGKSPITDENRRLGALGEIIGAIGTMLSQ
ncbi:Unknown protein [Striga hermonthica]|uniref:Pectinesterase inhibitor domain-containing protein n=1 Tax=Striga hermonthica TaxID=68872 RepID=A0A9N7NA78_STRHE|nr:Unknown protein [Striga hermonthica]